MGFKDDNARLVLLYRSGIKSSRLPKVPRCGYGLDGIDPDLFCVIKRALLSCACSNVTFGIHSRLGAGVYVTYGFLICFKMRLDVDQRLHFVLGIKVFSSACRPKVTKNDVGLVRM